ncbi:MAG: shikimate dehydrogenase [Alphaproteobacteria bacterium]|nr:shikimate dehydrogenase [Alphaproteobacteria bacterium]MCK5658555.1 shikimate dehydrogenase [Alphaproteobacteria bacterium]
MNDKNLINACVLGFPVSHSLSPKLHGFWLKKHTIHGAYTSMAVTPEHLPQALDILVERGFAGCNLTIPLKEIALSSMDEHDESCLMSGAVNTVVIRDGKKIGYNSDGFGFMESLKAQHPDWDGTRVVILGTGGAARGIIASLRGNGAKQFVLINRTREKAEKVLSSFKMKETTIVDWEDRTTALKEATLLVNCTSLGMTGSPPLELELSNLPKTATVCDIVYRPLTTHLLSDALQRGNPVTEGLPMLLHQGRLGFQHWFGVDPTVTPELYNKMKEGIT